MNSRIQCCAILALFGLVLVVGPLGAQPKDSSESEFDDLWSNGLIALAAHPITQKEMGVSEPVAAKLRALRDELRDTIRKEAKGDGLSLAGVSALPKKERDAKLDEIGTKAEPIVKRTLEKLFPRLSEILSTDEHLRLLAVNYSGTQGDNALGNEVVAVVLELSKEQNAKIKEMLTKIKELHGEANKVRNEIAAARTPLEKVAKVKELRAALESEKQVRQALPEVLTKDQQTAFNKLSKAYEQATRPTASPPDAPKPPEKEPQPNPPQRTAEEQAQLDQALKDNNAAIDLFSEGKPQAALELLKKSLATRQKILGEEHTATATSHGNLGDVLENLGQYAAARPHLDQALSVRRKLQGEEHPDVAHAFNSLGGLFESMEDYKNAQANHEQAVKIWRKVRGEEHADTATGLNNLALDLARQKNYAAARANYEQALRIRRKVFGDEHPTTASTLNNLGLLLDDQGDLAAAKPYYEQSLAIRRKAQGEEHPSTATAYHNLGVLLKQQGEAAAARPLLEKAIAIRRKALGDKHPLTELSLRALNSLTKTPAPTRTAEAQAQLDKALQEHETALTLFNDDKLQAALPLSKQSLATRQKILGEEHLATATSHNNLGLIFYKAGDFAAARTHLEQALTVRRKLLGDDSPDVALVLNNLGSVLEMLGDYKTSQQHHEQALKIWRKVRGEEHADTASGMNHLASILQQQGEFAAARAYFEQALKIRRKVYGDEHPLTATVLSNLGLLLSDQADLSSAKAYYEQSLKIRRRTLGDENLATASSYNNLGVLLLAQGDYAAARPLLEQTLAIRRKLQGPEHPLTATALNNLGALLKAQGDYAATRTYYEEALRVRLKALGEFHADTATSLDNLGSLAQDEGNYVQSRKYREQALQIRRKTLGDEHVDTATSLSNLGALLNDFKDYKAAIPYLKESLKVRRKLLGDENPNTAMSLNNLAYAWQALGERTKARPYHEQALEIRRKMLGNEHPDTGMSLFNLADLEGSDQNWQIAAKYVDQGRHGAAQHIQSVLPALSAKEQLIFLRQKDTSEFHQALSLGLTQRQDAGICRLSASWLLNGKAVAQSALASNALLARDERSPARAEAAQKLREFRQQLAQLALTSPQKGREQERLLKLQQLTEEEQQLTRQLSQAGGGAAPAPAWVELDVLRAVIPKDSVLVDVARFHWFSFEGRVDQPKWQPARYAAWITPPAGQGEAQVVDLGQVDEINALVTSVRAKLEGAAKPDGPLFKEGEVSAEESLRKDLTTLAERLWTPLATHVRAAKQVILSPDGELWLVPWGALPVGESEMLLEKFALRYVISGRDLLPTKEAAQANAPAILANPLFDATAASKKTSIQAIFKQLPVEGQLTTRSLGAKSAIPAVTPLPSTAVEAQAVQPNLEQFAGQPATLYTDGYALESVAKRLSRPRVAVFATHGFFLPEQESRSVESGSQTATDTRGALLDAAGKPIENPLLRCGLLLAGCNNRESVVGDDDGILTGMEICGIDFRGTELVVLSACETGVGKVHNGEGVAGLRQAFQLAGAKSVVSTLWSIPDRDSALLMNELFSNLAAGQSKPEALRNAQLKRIASRRDKYGAAHPFYWAAWTVTGN